VLTKEQGVLSPNFDFFHFLEVILIIQVNSVYLLSIGLYDASRPMQGVFLQKLMSEKNYLSFQREQIITSVGC